MQHPLPLDGFCCGPLFAPVVKRRPPTRPKGKEGIVHRAQTVRATPKWLTREQYGEVAALYREAKRRTMEAGELWVVDHIVPKISLRVCGLHVPWNLQVIPARENTAKSNAWWPDMWGPQQELFDK